MISKQKKDLLKVTFDVIGKGTTDVDLYVKDMAVGYIDSKTGYTISKKMLPVRNMSYIRNNRNVEGHRQEVTYQVRVTY